MTNLTKNATVKLLGGAAAGRPLELPLYECRVTAGFPSPADDYTGDKLDLNDLLIRKPAATFFVRVEGDAMAEAGICSSDLLVVDRSLQPKHRDIVIAELNGELAVKRISLKGRIMLSSEPEDGEPVLLNDDPDSAVWGVVTSVIHFLRA